MSPWAPRKPCAWPLCPELLPRGQSRCEKHRLPRWGEDRPTAGQRGYGQAWRKIRARVLERDQHTCTSCGEPATQVDHVIPKHRGGTDDESNLTSLCRFCHDHKTGAEGQAAR